MLVSSANTPQCRIMGHETDHQLTPTPLRQSFPRLAFRFLIIAVFVYLALVVFEWVNAQAMALEGPAQSTAMVSLLALALVGYAVLIAMPFMPGVEVGIVLLLMQGATIAPFVYLATLAGLFIAFCVGQFVSLDWLHDVFRDLRMIRACRLLDRIKSTPRKERLASLAERIPKWLSWVAVDYRYITIALLINLPGSIAIGGGGGIMMLAGLSRLFQTARMLLTLAIATAPIPLVVWIMGVDILK